MSASTAAIQAARRIRRCSSHLPVEVVPGSIDCEESLLSTESTVPGWGGQPGAPGPLERPLRRACALLVVEEPVHDGACAADVGAERTERAQFVGERRRGEVV